MPEKTVVVTDQEGTLLGKYPISLGSLNSPTSQREFIEEAKKCLREDGATPEQIAKAKFEVLEP